MSRVMTNQFIFSLLLKKWIEVTKCLFYCLTKNLLPIFFNKQQFLLKTKNLIILVWFHISLKSKDFNRHRHNLRFKDKKCNSSPTWLNAAEELKHLLAAEFKLTVFILLGRAQSLVATFLSWLAIFFYILYKIQILFCYFENVKEHTI